MRRQNFQKKKKRRNTNMKIVNVYDGKSLLACDPKSTIVYMMIMVELLEN